MLGFRVKSLGLGFRAKWCIGLTSNPLALRKALHSDPSALGDAVGNSLGACLYGTKSSKNGRIKTAKEAKFDELVCKTLLTASQCFAALLERKEIKSLVTMSSVTSALPEVTADAKGLASRIPTPGLLQLPLHDELRAAIKAEVAAALYPTGKNSASEAARTAASQQRAPKYQIGTKQNLLIGGESITFLEVLKGVL